MSFFQFKPAKQDLDCAAKSLQCRLGRRWGAVGGVGLPPSSLHAAQSLSEPK